MWRLGAEFCAVNYGSFPLHQSAAFVLAAFLLVSLSESACAGLKYASNNGVLIAISLLAGLLNCLHAFADYSLPLESPRSQGQGGGGGECGPALSSGSPGWLVLATLLEFLLFYLPSLAVALLFLCGDIAGNPRLPLAFPIGATPIFSLLNWNPWRLKAAPLRLSSGPCGCPSTPSSSSSSGRSPWAVPVPSTPPPSTPFASTHSRVRRCLPCPLPSL